MEKVFNIRFYIDQFTFAHNWLVENALALSIATFSQLLVIGLSFTVAKLLATYVRRSLSHVPAISQFEAPLRWIEGPLRWLAAAVTPLVLPILWLFLQWIALLAAYYFLLPNQLVVTTVSLTAAWIVIRFSTSFARNETVSRLISIFAWTIAALNIVGLLTPTLELLDSKAFNIGVLRISGLTVVNTLLSLTITLWLAAMAGRFLEHRVMASLSLSPSMQVLIVKLFKIFVVVVAVMLALYAVGIDLTIFAVFSGAIGIGIGFGLQKVVANFVSGITILVENSIRLGDVITVGETYGWVNTLGARFVSVLTRDGVEYLIPNEDLITQQVVNWSHSNDRVRLKAPFGVSYESDLHQVIKLCLEAVAESPRVIDEPKPTCLLMGFGDSSVDFELRFWIRDPRNGFANVKSDVLLRVWDRFQANNITIPFPQRDVHIISSSKDDGTGPKNDRAAMETVDGIGAKRVVAK